MRSNRVIASAVLVGLVVGAVTFLGAAKVPGDDAPSKKDSTVSPSQGQDVLVIFANVDIDNGVGLLPLFPDAFPQPCKVVKVHVKQGDKVKKGDPLADFDTELADLSVEEAKFGLARAEGALETAKGMLKQANEVLEGQKTAIDYTEKIIESKQKTLDAAKDELAEKERFADKLKAGAEVTAAKKKVEAAEKELQAERIKLEGMKRIQPTSKRDQAVGAVNEATAAVNLAKAQLSKALYGLKQMTLKAPVDGKIVDTRITEGLTFGAQTKMPAFFLQSDGPIIVRAEVDQEWASRVFNGQNAKIEDEGNSALSWSGKVIRVADSFMPKRSNSMVPEGLALTEARVLEFVVSVDNTDPKKPLRIGQRVKVTLKADSPTAK